MVKYYEKNGEQVSGEAIGGRLITTMTVGGALVSNPLITDIESDGWVEYIPSTPGDVQISAADWTALITAVNQLTGSSLVYTDPVSDITTAITALRNGVTFANLAKWWSLPILLSERATAITAISDSTIEEVGDYAFTYATGLTSVNLPNCTKIDANSFQGSGISSIELPNCLTVGASAFASCRSLTKLNLPNCTTIGQAMCQQSINLTYLSIPKAGGQANMTWGCTSLQSADMQSNNFTGLFNNNSGAPKLYRIHLCSSISTSINISSGQSLWNPTEGFSTTMNTLVPQQEWDLDENGDPIDCSQFTTNADKALWCFKHLFMPAFQNVQTTQTLTLKSTVYDVVTTDQDVLDYFSQHNWTLARTA